jgi:dTDP-4-dehydrorhamnose reductase
MGERERVSVVSDQRGSPTWAFDLANTIAALIAVVEGGKPVPAGIYHYTNAGDCTWFDFAQAIYSRGRQAGILAKECTVAPCTSAEFPAKVKRPAYSVLDKSKIQAALEITIPPWEQSLGEYVRNYARRNE